MLRKRSKKAFYAGVSAQSSSLLLGLGLATLLAQGAVVCGAGAVSAFGWAILAALAGCLVTTLLNWSALLNTLVPERATWKRALWAGLLIACALLLQGLALTSSNWSALDCLALAFIPWSRNLWRVVARAESFFGRRDRLFAIILVAAAGLYLWPEIAPILRVEHALQFKMDAHSTSFPTSIPRTLSFLAALALGAASSLQRAQERSISSLTFWSIPTAVAAVLLSLAGWIGMQLNGQQAFILSPADAASTSRLLLSTPALLFGTLFLAFRPRIHIKNTLQIGRELNSWWQFLGLGLGCALCLAFSSEKNVAVLDVGLFVLILLGHFIGLRTQESSVTFATTLTLVPQEESALQLARSNQSS